MRTIIIMKMDSGYVFAQFLIVAQNMNKIYKKFLKLIKRTKITWKNFRLHLKYIRLDGLKKR